jgi:hypothetical protein
MLSLLYVSESRIADFATDELSDIVAYAVRRNLQRNVTGALAHTGTHFAQVLEGPEPVVTDLIASIRRDSRHQRIRVVRAAYQSERRFPAWGMALVDAGPDIRRLVGEVLESDSAADWLAERLVEEMERSADPVI